METAKKTKKIISNLLIICSGFLLAAASYAVDNAAVKNALPGSTLPGVLSNYLANQQAPRNPGALPAIRRPQQAPSTLGPQAHQIKFKLTKIIVDGNYVYTDEQIATLYRDKLNTQISVADLQMIVQSVTNYYRNNGYILSRAILPPQHVKNGLVNIRVIEGYVDHINVVGIPKGARPLVSAYGEKIAQSRPLHIKVMEHYLRLANEIPGMQVKAVLEPSKTEVGASDLNLSAAEQTLTGSYSYDNYGTRYIGPNQNTVTTSLNSIFRPGDSTRATYATTTRPQQLKFYDFSYLTPFGSNGLTGIVGKNNSTTVPGLNLALIGIEGVSTAYYGVMQYPLLRTRAENLTIDGGVNYLDSQVTSFGSLLYKDHIRSIKFGANYDFADRFNASNLIGAHIEQGLNVLGASNNSNSFTTSRFGADGIFTKFVGQVARMQPIYRRFSGFILMNGQYSFSPLLAAQQFGFGGSQLGRGYDPAEIIGDKGLSGTVELRVGFAPGYAYLNSFEPYVFYDAGMIWNLKDVTGVNSKQSATSVGVGSRFVFTKNLSGNLMLAQPLTKSITAMELVGRGRAPRLL